MLTIDCHELTVDEQLALASALSEDLQGEALAFVRDDDIVFDVISGKGVDVARAFAVAKDFVARRKDAQYYSIERDGERLIVHSADPLARSRERKRPDLPANILKCPACGFVTQYEEALVVHWRAHYAGLSG